MEEGVGTRSQTAASSRLREGHAGRRPDFPGSSPRGAAEHQPHGWRCGGTFREHVMGCVRSPVAGWRVGGPRRQRPESGQEESGWWAGVRGTHKAEELREAGP